MKKDRFSQQALLRIQKNEHWNHRRQQLFSNEHWDHCRQQLVSNATLRI